MAYNAWRTSPIGSRRKGSENKDRLAERRMVSMIEKSINTPAQRETKSFRWCISVKLNRGLRGDHQSHVCAPSLCLRARVCGSGSDSHESERRVSFPLRESSLLDRGAAPMETLNL